MDEQDWLAERFEAHRTHLRAVAYRMLGSTSEADDAVQEAWLRLHRADVGNVENLGGWLTRVVARVCLDMLRSRTSRREDPLVTDGTSDIHEPAAGPEDEAVLADSVGLALLVVLEALAPAERLAFVLHDMFAMPFDEIAPILGRSPAATRQLASRARRRVQGTTPTPDLVRQREVVDAFLAASRGGDFAALVAVLDPDVVLHAEAAGVPSVVRGAHAVATGASSYARRSVFARAATINGAPGIVVAPRGKLMVAMTFTVRDDRIAEIDVITDQNRLRALDITI